MLKNTALVSKEMVTQFGMVKFDAEGISNDLKEKEQEVLGKLKGFEYTPAKEEKQVEKPKAVVPEIKEVEKPTEEKEVEEEEPKKAKKTVAKKVTKKTK